MEEHDLYMDTQFKETKKLKLLVEEQNKKMAEMQKQVEELKKELNAMKEGRK